MLPVMNATRRVKVSWLMAPARYRRKIPRSGTSQTCQAGSSGLPEFLPRSSSERQRQTRHRRQTRCLLILPAAFQALGVGGLPRVLQAVRNRADQPDAEGHLRVPPGVDDAVQAIVTQPASEPPRSRGTASW